MWCDLHRLLGSIERNLSTDTTRQPFRWNGAYGYEYIPATGLYHVGAREYDPRTGRWLQRDPIGVAGGHPNGYVYCGNDPVNDVDPTGMDTHVFEYAEFILVVTTIQFRGPNANRANCERVVNSMLRAWNQGFTCNGKPVIFTINWEIGGKEKPYHDQVYMVPGGGDKYKRSWVRGEFMYPMPNYWKGRLHDQYLRPNQQHTCVLYSSDPDYDWMVAHEYGHLLGLGDRYRDRIINGQTVSIPDPGWAGNIMGRRGMPVEQRNIDEFCRRAKKWKAWHIVEK
ncbi:MAG: RHS repeat-associated core domain-containing protein [Fimbriimonadales bacterium]